MTFTEPAFLLFLFACWALNRLCPPRFRAAFLLVASYSFYLTWSARAAGLLAALTILTFFGARYSEQQRTTRKRGLAWFAPLGVVLLTGYLMAFKVALLTPTHGIAGLIMPLGISYYTFKLISYLLDVFWGKMPASQGLVPFAAYIAFFPQIVAGPIQRPDDFFEQLPPKPHAISDALPRIAWGLSKKFLIADNLAPAVNAVFANVTHLHGAPLLLGFYLFPLQLYADFSGLTDIAIGTGRLLGITGPENFNRPFTASTITDFWRRWHMSLTNWLVDYLFMPLRMATRRAATAGLVFSITINMVAIGLWHGLDATYFVFGVLNAAYLVAEVLTSRRRAKFFKQHPQCDGIGTWLGWLVTFHLIFIAEVFFRARSVSDAMWLLSHLLTGLGSSIAMLQNLIGETGVKGLAIGLSGYLVLELAERFRPDLTVSDWYRSGPRWVRWSLNSGGVALAVFGLALLLVYTTGKRAPFLYEIF